MRIFSLHFLKIAAILALILIVTIFGTRITRPNFDPTIMMQSLPLNSEDPSQTKVGPLRFISAWELTSDNPNFGGISALTIIEDDRFLGVSDAGTLIAFGLKGDEKVDRPFIAPLPGSKGEKLTFADRDSEAIAYDANSGRFWVAYEYRNAVRRFSRSFARTEKFVQPKLMKNWSQNSGPEALVRLKDGRFVIFSEGADLPDGSYEAILFSGDPTVTGSAATSFGYRPPKGYKVTDATQLPSGKLIILHRRISFPKGFTIKLGILDPLDIVSTDTVSSEVIATLEPPLLVDNLEGITLSQEDDKTILWMISDNNFNIFQRTILMKFELLNDYGPEPSDGIKKPDDIIAPGFESL